MPTTPVRAQRPTALSAMAAFGSAVVTALLLLLYGYRRQPYIMLWMLSWSLMAASLTVMSVDFDNRALGLSMLGFAQFLGIAAALLLVLGADTYRRRALPGPRYLFGLLPLLIWFTLAPIGLGSQSVIVPGYLISAGLLVTAGLAYLAVLRGARFLGAGLIGIMLLLLGCTNAWVAISVSGSGSTALIPVQLMVLNALLYVFAALGMHLLVFEDMTYELRVTNRQLKGAQAELHELAITDPLTGCHNRRFFDEVIGRELQRHRRYHIPLSLLFVDIDRFKAVNDSLGHEAGDRVLQDVAAFLKGNVREADYVFRWGGDEFLVLISCQLEEALQKGAALKSAFQIAPEAAELPSGVGLSVGCSEVFAGSDDILVRVREADERMYRDKVGAR